MTKNLPGTVPRQVLFSGKHAVAGSIQAAHVVAQEEHIVRAISADVIGERRAVKVPVIKAAHLVKIENGQRLEGVCKLVSDNQDFRKLRPVRFYNRFADVAAHVVGVEALAGRADLNERRVGGFAVILPRIIGERVL